MPFSTLIIPATTVVQQLTFSNWQGLQSSLRQSDCSLHPYDSFQATSIGLILVGHDPLFDMLAAAALNAANDKYWSVVEEALRIFNQMKHLYPHPDFWKWAEISYLPVAAAYKMLRLAHTELWIVSRMHSLISYNGYVLCRYQTAPKIRCWSRFRTSCGMGARVSCGWLQLGFYRIPQFECCCSALRSILYMSRLNLRSHKYACRFHFV